MGLSVLAGAAEKLRYESCGWRAHVYARPWQERKYHKGVIHGVGF